MMDSIIQLSPIIAHRGARSLAPENTLAAMQKAKALGAEWVEFDVMLTVDGEAIVIHDTRLDRTTNGVGEVGETTYKEILKLDAGSWFSSEYKKEKIPGFSEMLKCLIDLELIPNVEIKPYPGQDNKTALVVMETIHKLWPKTAPKPLISSFSIESLRVARSLDPHVPIGIVCTEINFDWKKLAEELNAISVHVCEKNLNADLIHAIKSTGRYVLSYTINNLASGKKLFSEGVDAIFTDDLPTFSEYL
ncbi:MAG: glycerophosphoryl diester phosphodiesterase [Proteobacteria bacterium]|nr:glycerophosphoryl diester phosphodiesterase [Pseudomonadota bacterium]